MRNGRLVEKGGPDDVRQTVQRSDLPCPQFISDQMPPCEHVDGRFYTSKAAFRQVTRANGLTEVGNEKLPNRRPKMTKAQREAGIDRAVERAVARVS
jgi:hypothetical protein